MEPFYDLPCLNREEPTFIGPIADQDGLIRIAEGEFWGNDKMGDWDWLIEGMIGEAQ